VSGFMGRSLDVVRFFQNNAI
jgi:hypothetical protein